MQLFVGDVGVFFREGWMLSCPLAACFRSNAGSGRYVFMREYRGL